MIRSRSTSGSPEWLASFDIHFPSDLRPNYPYSSEVNSRLAVIIYGPPCDAASAISSSTLELHTATTVCTVHTQPPSCAALPVLDSPTSFATCENHAPLTLMSASFHSQLRDATYTLTPLMSPPLLYPQAPREWIGCTQFASPSLLSRFPPIYHG